MSDNSIDMLMVVAKVLNRLPQPVVYTGGATIPLYLDALSARDMRPMAPAFLAARDRLAGRAKLLLETIDLLARLI